jgi:hypothetical protein
MYLWKLYDSIAKEKKPSNFYFANLGGGIRSTANLVKLGEICEWFQCDNQGRGGDDTPIWGCALQGRVCNAVQKGKMATNVTAAWSTGRRAGATSTSRRRKNRCGSTRRWPAGMVPYHHIIGGENGWARTAAGWSPRASTSTGWRSTTPTSSTSAPSPISAW